MSSRPRTTIKILRVEYPSNILGKAYVATLITVPPRAATPPHTHNGAAVYAQVIKGSVISQMIHSHAGSKDHGSRASSLHDSGEFPHELLRCAQLTIPGVGIYRQGEMWYEAPGCQHVRSENVSDDEEAAFYANFIIDADKLAGLAEKDLGRVLTILDVDPRSPHFSPPAEVP